MKNPSKGFLIIVTFLLVIMLLMLTYIYIAQPMVIAGISMTPSFPDGKNVIGFKLHSKIQRGDVVIFTAPEEICKDDGTVCTYVSRVIGLPGEKVEIANYYVKINDVQITESYLAPDTHTLFSEKVGGIFNLKEDEYFVMGDNRPYSNDSRIFGPIKKSSIQSVVFK